MVSITLLALFLQHMTKHTGKGQPGRDLRRFASSLTLAALVCWLLWLYWSTFTLPWFLLAWTVARFTWSTFWRTAIFWPPYPYFLP